MGPCFLKCLLVESIVMAKNVGLYQVPAECIIIFMHINYGYILISIRLLALGDYVQ